MQSARGGGVRISFSRWRVHRRAWSRPHRNMEAIVLQERERHRIADRLRDGPAQVLANLVMEMRSLLYLLDGETLDMDAVRPALEKMLQEMEDGLYDLRKIIEDLRPPFLFRELGLIPWLENLALQYREEHHLEVDLQVAPDLDPISEDVESVLRRVIQEALRNVIQHARAGKVVIRLYRDEADRLVLDVEDDGLGLDIQRAYNAYTDLQTKGTFGLLMMEEWARLVNGHLKISGHAGKGTLVRLQIPAGWRGEIRGERYGEK